MVSLDIKALLRAFVFGTTRRPRVVVPYLWDPSHTRALGIEKALSVSSIRLSPTQSYEPDPAASRDAPSERTPVGTDRLDVWVKGILLNFPLANGIRRFVRSKQFYLEATAGEIFAVLQQLMTDGKGRVFFPEGAITNKDWYLDHKGSDGNELKNVYIHCMEWRAEVRFTGGLELVTRSTNTRAPILAFIDADAIGDGRDATIDPRNIIKRKDSSNVRRLAKSALREEAARDKRLLSTVNVDSLDPVLFAILIGSAQEQLSRVPGRDFYTSHVILSRSNHTDNSRSALDIITLTGRFSASYLENMKDSKPTSSPTTTTPDEIDIQARIIEFFPATTREGEDGIILRNLCVLMHHLGGLVVESARDLGLSSPSASLAQHTPTTTAVLAQPTIMHPLTPQATPSPPTSKKRAADESIDQPSSPPKRLKTQQPTATSSRETPARPPPPSSSQLQPNNKRSPPRDTIPSQRTSLRKHARTSPVLDKSKVSKQKRNQKVTIPPTSQNRARTRSQTAKRRALEGLDANHIANTTIVANKKPKAGRGRGR